MKEEKGITLVALVITIVILLILAAIGMQTILGENGIIKKAKEAKAKAEEATKKEEKELLNYSDYLDEATKDKSKIFITEWTVNAGDTIVLPLTSDGIYDFTVDYGDYTGKKEVKTNTSQNASHTYTEAGTYQVSIEGTCTVFDFPVIYGGEDSHPSRKNITKLVNWGETGLTRICFYECSNLKGEIPSPNKDSFKEVTSFSSAFRGCSGLTGSIPAELFANCPKVTDFEGTFQYCRGLTGNIPAKLFASCQKVTSFAKTFYECYSLTGNIPAELFASCQEVTSFEKTFYECYSLTGNIPAELFANCLKVTDFGGTFWNCDNLTGNIPVELFANCVNITEFENTFCGCRGLTGSIPAELFANCPEVIDFYNTFSGCSGLTGEPLPLWNRTGVTGKSCYSECNNMNLTNVPAEWK